MPNTCRLTPVGVSRSQKLCTCEQEERHQQEDSKQEKREGPVQKLIGGCVPAEGCPDGCVHNAPGRQTGSVDK
jgi:hypothetical protein